MADEVGLGKTIEAGIVLAQRWAERKRAILLVLPATLRKQWQQELADKFALPSVILEAKSFNQCKREGVNNPFEQEGKVVICSYHFVKAKAAEIKKIKWDLVVIDEAHRMRNVYRSDNKLAKAIAEATSHANKLLLTATPLQNSLLELYGLVSVIDPHVFGDITSFREQFVRVDNERKRNAVLKARLEPICRRTLRQQVLEYVRFTQRTSITQNFLPTDEEHTLYQLVSDYLQKDVLIALPASQRQLMTLVLRKLLASSTYAIAGTLRRLVTRLETKEGEQQRLQDALDDDFEALDELLEEWDESPEPMSPPERELLQNELSNLKRYAELAEKISHNAKGAALLEVLGTAFERIRVLGASRKAVIFTESRRTQQYLFNYLSEHGYQGEIVLMNGSNNDLTSKQIYESYAERHQNSAQLSGSRSADMKAAIVEEFRDRATLLIATESAAEGVNLQFCSLVVNYDLPWNPQRIEQRIGRCHRYGQQHDVVVVNFLNRRNAADQRVFELLSEKFKLFDGVFGASDEVLGALESGVDLEKRIASAYQTCRTAGEIQAAFDTLQSELEETIQTRMDQTRQVLFEHFDEEVHDRLKIHKDKAQATLSERQRWLLELTRNELKGQAAFVPNTPAFTYDSPQHATYHFDWKTAEAMNAVFYRLEHPLAQKIVAQALNRPLGTADLTFAYSAHPTRIAILESLVEQSGWLELSKLTVNSVQAEEFLVFAALTDAGQPLDQEQCQRLFSVAASETQVSLTKAPIQLADVRAAEFQRCLAEVNARNASYFEEEETKLDRWAEDLKFGLEQEIKDIDRQIREAKKHAKAVVTLAEKLEAQKTLRSLEQSRNRKRRELYNAQDEVEQQRDSLISQLERQLQLEHKVESLFLVRWIVS